MKARGWICLVVVGVAACSAVVASIVIEEQRARSDKKQVDLGGSRADHIIHIETKDADYDFHKGMVYLPLAKLMMKRSAEYYAFLHAPLTEIEADANGQTVKWTPPPVELPPTPEEERESRRVRLETETHFHRP